VRHSRHAAFGSLARRERADDWHPRVRAISADLLDAGMASGNLWRVSSLENDCDSRKRQAFSGAVHAAPDREHDQSDP
jgi:hypothetical protein